MECLRCLICLILAVGSAAGAPVVAADETEHQQVLSLVQRLAAPQFAVRVQAEERLLELGPAVLPTLRSAEENSELETRYRLRRVIEALESAQREVALEAFRSGGRPSDPKLQTAWARFSHQVGHGHDARELFAEIVHYEPWLVEALSGPIEGLRRKFESRCADIKLRMQRQESRRPIATVAALLFAAGIPECQPSATATSCLTECLQEGDFGAAMQRPNRPEPLERLVGIWISQPEASTAVQRLQLGARFELPEGVDVALEIIRQRLAGPQIQHAILYLAKAGSRTHLHELESLLDDTTELQVRRQGSTTTFSSRVQDVALAALLHMTEQKPEEYGFAELRENPQYLYVPATIGFDSDEQRRAALDKWRRWSAENLKDVHPLVDQAALGYST